MASEKMTAEQLAVLADDIADMAADFVNACDAKSLKNMATNLAGMIRLHVPQPAAAAVRASAPLKSGKVSMQDHWPNCVEHGPMRLVSAVWTCRSCGSVDQLDDPSARIGASDHEQGVRDENHQEETKAHVSTQRSGGHGDAVGLSHPAGHDPAGNAQPAEAARDKETAEVGVPPVGALRQAFKDMVKFEPDDKGRPEDEAEVIAARAALGK